MLRQLTNGMKSWLVGGLVIAALLVAARPAAAINPNRPAVFDESKAVLGFWQRLDSDDNGRELGQGLKLEASGLYRLEVTDEDQKVVYQGFGTYTYEGGVLTLTLKKELGPDGNLQDVSDCKAQKMEVTFFHDALDLKVGAVKQHWTKGRLNQD